MSNASNLSILLPAGGKVSFERNWDLTKFLNQFQLACPKILCVVDGLTLQYYDSVESIPRDLSFNYKRTGNPLTEYYFRDQDGSSYCIFGRNTAAKVAEANGISMEESLSPEQSTRS